ncbi:YjcB family protein [Erwinia tracheiphila]
MSPVSTGIGIGMSCWFVIGLLGISLSMEICSISGRLLKMYLWA